MTPKSLFSKLKFKDPVFEKISWTKLSFCCCAEFCANKWTNQKFTFLAGFSKDNLWLIFWHEKNSSNGNATRFPRFVEWQKTREKLKKQQMNWICKKTVRNQWYYVFKDNLTDGKDIYGFAFLFFWQIQLTCPMILRMLSLMTSPISFLERSIRKMGRLSSKSSEDDRYEDHMPIRRPRILQ